MTVEIAYTKKGFVERQKSILKLLEASTRSIVCLGIDKLLENRPAHISARPRQGNLGLAAFLCGITRIGPSVRRQRPIAGINAELSVLIPFS